MATYRMDSLGDAMRHGYLLKVACRSCPHEAYHKPGAMIAAFGAFRPLASLRFDCTKCGRRNYDLSVIDPIALPEKDIIVWHPVRAKRKIDV